MSRGSKSSWFSSLPHVKQPSYSSIFWIRNRNPVIVVFYQIENQWCAFIFLGWLECDLEFLYLFLMNRIRSFYVIICLTFDLCLWQLKIEDAIDVTDGGMKTLMCIKSKSLTLWKNQKITCKNTMHPLANSYGRFLQHNSLTVFLHGIAG